VDGDFFWLLRKLNTQIMGYSKKKNRYAKEEKPSSFFCLPDIHSHQKLSYIYTVWSFNIFFVTIYISLLFLLVDETIFGC